MATVRTGIGKSKRDLLGKIARLKLVVAAKTKNGEFTNEDKIVFKKVIVSMTLAYKLLDKIDCVQKEMSIPFGYHGRVGGRGGKARRAR